MNQNSKAMELYEYYVDNIHNKVDKARTSIESISVEIDEVNLTDEEWKRIDELVTKALIELDRIE